MMTNEIKINTIAFLFVIKIKFLYQATLITLGVAWWNFNRFLVKEN